jgi:hypothetical protein
MPPNTVILMGLITIVAMFGFIPSKWFFFCIKIRWISLNKEILVVLNGGLLNEVYFRFPIGKQIKSKNKDLLVWLKYAVVNPVIGV